MLRLRARDFVDHLVPSSFFYPRTRGRAAAPWVRSAKLERRGESPAGRGGLYVKSFSCTS